MELKEIYTAKELAELLNVLPQTIRRHIQEGKLKATKFNGSYIIKKEDVEELIKAKGGGV